MSIDDIIKKLEDFIKTADKEMGSLGEDLSEEDLSEEDLLFPEIRKNKAAVPRILKLSMYKFINPETGELELMDSHDSIPKESREIEEMAGKGELFNPIYQFIRFMGSNKDREEMAWWRKNLQYPEGHGRKGRVYYRSGGIEDSEYDDYMTKEQLGLSLRDHIVSLEDDVEIGKGLPFSGGLSATIRQDVIDMLRGMDSGGRALDYISNVVDRAMKSSEKPLRIHKKVSGRGKDYVLFYIDTILKMKNSVIAKLIHEDMMEEGTLKKIADVGNRLLNKTLIMVPMFQDALKNVIDKKLMGGSFDGLGKIASDLVIKSSGADSLKALSEATGGAEPSRIKNDPSELYRTKSMNNNRKILNTLLTSQLLEAERKELGNSVSYLRFERDRLNSMDEDLYRLTKVTVGDPTTEKEEYYGKQLFDALLRRERMGDLIETFLEKNLASYINASKVSEVADKIVNNNSNKYSSLREYLWGGGVDIDIIKKITTKIESNGEVSDENIEGYQILQIKNLFNTFFGLFRSNDTYYNKGKKGSKDIQYFILLEIFARQYRLNGVEREDEIRELFISYLKDVKESLSEDPSRSNMLVKNALEILLEKYTETMDIKRKVDFLYYINSCMYDFLCKSEIVQEHEKYNEDEAKNINKLKAALSGMFSSFYADENRKVGQNIKAFLKYVRDEADENLYSNISKLLDKEYIPSVGDIINRIENREFFVTKGYKEVNKNIKEFTKMISEYTGEDTPQKPEEPEETEDRSGRVDYQAQVLSNYVGDGVSQKNENITMTEVINNTKKYLIDIVSGYYQDRGSRRERDKALTSLGFSPGDEDRVIDKYLTDPQGGTSYSISVGKDERYVYPPYRIIQLFKAFLGGKSPGEKQEFDDIAKGPALNELRDLMNKIKEDDIGDDREASVKTAEVDLGDNSSNIEAANELMSISNYVLDISDTYKELYQGLVQEIARDRYKNNNVYDILSESSSEDSDEGYEKISGLLDDKEDPLDFLDRLDEVVKELGDGRYSDNVYKSIGNKEDIYGQLLELERSYIVLKNAMSEVSSLLRGDRGPEEMRKELDLSTDEYEALQDSIVTYSTIINNMISESYDKIMGSIPEVFMGGDSSKSDDAMALAVSMMSILEQAGSEFGAMKGRIEKIDREGKNIKYKANLYKLFNGIYEAILSSRVPFSEDMGFNYSQFVKDLDDLLRGEKEYTISLRSRRKIEGMTKAQLGYIESIPNMGDRKEAYRDLISSVRSSLYTGTIINVPIGNDTKNMIVSEDAFNYLTGILDAQAKQASWGRLTREQVTEFINKCYDYVTHRSLGGEHKEYEFFIYSGNIGLVMKRWRDVIDTLDSSEEDPIIYKRGGGKEEEDVVRLSDISNIYPKILYKVNEKYGNTYDKMEIDRIYVQANPEKMGNISLDTEEIPGETKRGVVMDWIVNELMSKEDKDKNKYCFAKNVGEYSTSYTIFLKKGEEGKDREEIEEEIRKLLYLPVEGDQRSKLKEVIIEHIDENIGANREREIRGIAQGLGGDQGIRVGDSVFFLGDDSYYTVQIDLPSYYVNVIDRYLKDNLSDRYFGIHEAIYGAGGAINEKTSSIKTGEEITEDTSGENDSFRIALLEKAEESGKLVAGEFLEILNKARKVLEVGGKLFSMMEEFEKEIQESRYEEIDDILDYSEDIEEGIEEDVEEGIEEDIEEDAEDVPEEISKEIPETVPGETDFTEDIEDTGDAEKDIELNLPSEGPSEEEISLAARILLGAGEDLDINNKLRDSIRDNNRIISKCDVDMDRLKQIMESNKIDETEMLQNILDKYSRKQEVLKSINNNIHDAIDKSGGADIRENDPLISLSVWVDDMEKYQENNVETFSEKLIEILRQEPDNVFEAGDMLDVLGDSKKTVMSVMNEWHDYMRNDLSEVSSLHSRVIPIVSRMY